MIKSMTGFGRADLASETKQVTIEIKSVNHRYSEVNIKMPRQYLILEEKLRKQILEKVVRGRVDVFIKIEETGEKKRNLKVDKDLAVSYYNSLKELADLANISSNIEIFQLAQLPEVLKVEDDEESLEEILLLITQCLSQALDQLVEMRTLEGEKLKSDLSERLDSLTQMHENIFKRAPLIVQEYKEKLNIRIKELMDNHIIDETRLATEVAIFADKSSITEELVRLKAHIEQFHQFLKAKDPVGRKLDFLLQEMNRETNTIGSKGNDLLIAQIVLELKSEIEKIREQVQNIE